MNAYTDADLIWIVVIILACFVFGTPLSFWLCSPKGMKCPRCGTRDTSVTWEHEPLNAVTPRSVPLERKKLYCFTCKARIVLAERESETMKRIIDYEQTKRITRAPTAHYSRR